MDEEKDGNSEDEFRSVVINVGAEATELRHRLIESISGDSDGFLEVLNEINAKAISRRASLALLNVERLASDDFPDLEFRPGWLVTAMKDDINEIESSWSDLREAGLKLGRSWRQNEGIGALIACVVNAHLDPLESLLSIVGKGSVEKETQQLSDKFGDCLAIVGHQLESLPASIELHVVSEVRVLEGRQAPRISMSTWGFVAVAVYLVLRLTGIL